MKNVMKQQNIASLLWFELLHKVVSLALLLPAAWLLMSLCMRSGGYGYLTRENISQFMRRPETLAALVFLAAVVLIGFLVDVSGVISISAWSRQGKKVSMPQIFLFAIRNVRQLFAKKNMLLILLPICVGIVWNINITSAAINFFRLPDTAGDLAGGAWYPFVYAATLAAEFLVLRLLYAFPYYTLTGCGAAEAVKKSLWLSRKKSIVEPLILLCGQSIVYLIRVLIIKGGIVFLGYLEAVFEKEEFIHVPYATVVWFVLFAFMLVGWALVVPVSCICGMELFYWRQSNAQEGAIPVLPEEQIPVRFSRRMLRWLEILLLAAGLVSCAAFGYGFTTGHINVPVEELKVTQVSAHRGASWEYPENTMAAFEAAAELGADWIELDVRESSDGQLFIMHDASLLRTTGVRRYTWELTWDELSQLDAGSYMGWQFSGEPIPLLSDVITFAKENGLRLNIELKPYRQDPDYVRHVVELVEENGFEGDCVLACSAYWVLQEVKRQNPDLKTVYVMSLAYGNIDQLGDADVFSVKDVSVTERLVSTVHNAGKEIYGWTVNSKNRIYRMINLNVDNIITDNISLAKECIYTQKTEEIMEEYTE